MANFSGVAQGYIDSQQAIQQQRLRDAQIAQMLQSQQQQKQQYDMAQQQFQRQQQARQAAGQFLLSNQQPPQMPQPPMPGQNSAPPQPPQGGGMPSPGGMPAGGQPQLPPPPQAAAPQPPAPPMPPQHGPQWTPMPQMSQAPAGGSPGTPQLPAPPATASPDQGIAQPRQFDLKSIIGTLSQQGVPGDKVMDVLDQLSPIMSAQNKSELEQFKVAHQLQQDTIKFQQQRLKELTDQKRLDQGDRRLDIEDKRAGQAEKKMNAILARTASANGAGGFEQQDVDYWADVVRKGGALPPRLATTPGGKKLTADIMKAVARSPGASAEDMLQNQAEFQGEKSAERTLGTRGATADMAATEANSLANLALDASEKLGRSGIKDINTAQQAVQKHTASPELRAFVAANTSLINAYAKAINPQGVAHAADKEHAREMLDTGFSKGDYRATVAQLRKEIEAARASPGQVKADMRKQSTGSDASVIPAGWKVTEH